MLRIAVSSSSRLPCSRTECLRQGMRPTRRSAQIGACSLSSVFLSTVGEQHPCTGAVPVRVHGFAHRRGGRNPRSYYKGNLGFAAQPPAKNAPAGCTSNFVSFFHRPGEVRSSFEVHAIRDRIVQRKASGTELVSTFSPQVSIKGLATICALAPSCPGKSRSIRSAREFRSLRSGRLYQ